MLWPGQEILLKKQLFDLEVKGQGLPISKDKKLWPGQENTIKKQLFQRSNEGHYGM